MALNSASPSIGLVKNSMAPAFMARTDVVTLPLPVIKMIGMYALSPAIRFCRSKPVRPGSKTSNTRQVGLRRGGRERNSGADAKTSAFQPALLINNSSDSRTDSSSSTTNTVGEARGPADDRNSFTRMLAEFIADIWISSDRPLAKQRPRPATQRMHYSIEGCPLHFGVGSVPCDTGEGFVGGAVSIDV